MHRGREGKQKEGASRNHPRMENWEIEAPGNDLVAPVVAIVTIVVIAAIADREVGSASTINPNATVVVAPGAPIDAGRFAALAN